MVRTRGQEMRRLQRKLIPVNLLVCILCIVAAVTLFFTPLLKIDLGKIVGSEQVQQMLSDEVDKALVPESNGGDSEAAASEGGSSINFDYATILKAVIKPIFGGVKGDIVLSPMEMTKLAFNDKPGELLVTRYLTGEKGLVTQLVKSLAETIADLGNQKEVTDAIEDMIVEAVAMSLKETLPEEFKALVNDEELQTTIKKLDTVENEDQAVSTIVDFMDELAAKNEGNSALSAEEKTSLENSVREMYKEVVAETRDEATGEDNFSMEALICVMASKGMNEAFGEGGLGSLISGAIGSDSDGNESVVKATRNILTDGEVSGGAEVGSGEDSGESGSTEEGATEGGTEGGSTETETPKGTVYTNYSDLFGSLIKPEDTDKMVEDITNSINGSVGGLTESINEKKSIFMIVWGVLVFFVALWVILFLFAFFHLFARNKRFTMWYVKLFAPYPCIIFWLAPTVFKMLLAKGTLTATFGESTVAVLSIVMTGISSMTWIMGLCYLLLWAVSIFWAFPIKRKIRRLKKGD